ncbi:MAG: hypothetical protein ABSB52_00175 [Acidimicrobiales bacterium]|jgi:hypothetical protein
MTPPVDQSWVLRRGVALKAAQTAHIELLSNVGVSSWWHRAVDNNGDEVLIVVYADGATG